jgi:FMN phosphatase YigB (HAD superfamily)
MTMPPRVIYFDLGNVVLHFDHHRQCRQMAEVASVDPQRAWQVLFDEHLQRRYELGELSERQFFAEFNERLGAHAPPDQLRVAACDIFELNATLLPLIVQLEAAGYPLGLISNTCASHWAWVTDGRYGILPAAFDFFALSFEIGAVKPNPRIFREAAARASAAPGEIFYCDDLPEHVEAARALGFDAVLYTTTPVLAEQLLRRGVRCNF